LYRNIPNLILLSLNPLPVLQSMIWLKNTHGHGSFFKLVKIPRILNFTIFVNAISQHRNALHMVLFQLCFQSLKWRNQLGTMQLNSGRILLGNNERPVSLSWSHSILLRGPILHYLSYIITSSLRIRYEASLFTFLLHYLSYIITSFFPISPFTFFFLFQFFPFIFNFILKFLLIIIQVAFKLVKLTKSHSFETRPGPAGRPGAGTGPGWRKNGGRKNPVWPGWPDGSTRWPGWPGKTRSRPGDKPVDFCFFLFFFY